MQPTAIDDDPALLDLFIGDMDRQSDLWKPTTYWHWQCRRMQRQLERTGLAGFRRNWALMQGVDLGPKQAGIARRPLYANKVMSSLARRVPPGNRYDRYVDALIAESNRAHEAEIAREVSLLYQLLRRGEWSEPICSRVQDSGVGEPYLYAFEGRQYSSNLLCHVCLLAFLFRIARTDECRRVVEIGGGYGALPEVLCKYRAGNIDYFVEIDIPPLVYVTTQYLKAVFPGRVVDYRQARSASSIKPADVAGKILVIPPWLVPALDLEFDLFWNSASFQEMERDVVENYLSRIGSRASRIFINSLTAGHPPGLGGQREPISFEGVAGQIRAHGFVEHLLDEDCIEGSAVRALLPRHTAALFTKR